LITVDFYVLSSPSSLPPNQQEWVRRIDPPNQQECVRRIDHGFVPEGLWLGGVALSENHQLEG